MSIASDAAAADVAHCDLCPTSCCCCCYSSSYSYSHSCCSGAAAGSGDGEGGDAAARVRLVSMSNALAVSETAVQQQQCGMWHSHCGQRPVEQCPHISCGCLHQLRC